MKKIKLLDCTLRDGGYVNDWKFGYANICNVFERLVDSNVDVIEIGFLDERRPFDIDSSIMPDTNSVEAIYGRMDRKHAKVVGMIDYGTCGLEHIQPCAESYLDGIRVIFKKHLMHQAMEYCAQLKNLGYEVYSQLVSITSYSDKELMELIQLVNEVKPYAVSMVDTYGLLHPHDLLHYYSILDKYVDENVQIGFHAHNNFQLAYANALAFLEKDAVHDVVVDGTLFGMGKSAGNAPLELLSMRLNDCFGGDYKISPMLESIEESVMEFYRKTPWGYKTFFYLAAKNECHPSYVSYYMEKSNMSVSKIDDILSKIGPEEKKLLYDKLVAEHLYESFYQEVLDDSVARKRLADELKDRKILLIGPGKNICLQRAIVDKYMEENRPYVISINYIPEGIKTDCVFVTNSKRYHNIFFGDQKIIATTNVECKGGEFDFVIDRAPLLEKNETIMDNSFLMLLKLLKSVGVSDVVCAGFDGYSEKDDNYFDPKMEYLFVKEKSKHLNIHIREVILELRENMDISFLTYSAYDRVEDVNNASF